MTIIAKLLIINLFARLSMSICLSIHLSIYLSIYLSTYLSICLSVCPSVRPSFFLSFCQPAYLSFCLSRPVALSTFVLPVLTSSSRYSFSLSFINLYFAFSILSLPPPPVCIWTYTIISVPPSFLFLIFSLSEMNVGWSFKNKTPSNSYLRDFQTPTTENMYELLKLDCLVGDREIQENSQY